MRKLCWRSRGKEFFKEKKTMVERMKGTTELAMPMAMACLPGFLRRERSVLTPMTKRKKMREMTESRSRMKVLRVGKSVLLNLELWPMIVGPRRMPV